MGRGVVEEEEDGKSKKPTSKIVDLKFIVLEAVNSLLKEFRIDRIAESDADDKAWKGNEKLAVLLGTKRKESRKVSEKDLKIC